jgi:nitroreductase
VSDERASFLHFDDIPWADERAGGGGTAPAAPAALVEAAERSGARRKRVVTGQAGFYMNHSEMPAGFTVPPHAHDRDELIVVLAGGCTMLDGGPSLGPSDSMVLRAGHTYGFTCGPAGMTFLTIRTGEAGTALQGSVDTVDTSPAPAPASTMSVFDAIYSLRAVRTYEDRPIPAADLDRILRAATMACSSGNTQPWEFLVLRDRELKTTIRDWMREAMKVPESERVQSPEQLIDGAGRPVTGYAAIESLDTVPAVVLVFWNPDRGVRFQGEYEENPDGTLRPLRDIVGGRGSSLYPACQNMMLAASALGVSSLFTTFFGLCERQIKDLLGVPPRMFLEAGIYLGYSAEKLGPARRRPLTEVVHVDRWDTAYEPPDEPSSPAGAGR